MNPPLLWSQQSYWDTHRTRQDRDSSKIATSWAIPAGTTAHAVASAVAELVRRHESLRTTFPLEAGQPVQRVHPVGRIQLPELTGDVRKLTAQVAAARMDPQTDLPFRAAVVTVDGRPDRLVVVFNHIIVDGISMEILWRDFVRLLGNPLAPQRATQSAQELAIAQQHADPASALSYWERCLAEGPRATFPHFQPLSAYLKAELTGMDLQPCAELVARRHRVVPSMVYLTVFNVFLALLSGNPVCLLYVSYVNRTPELENTVACLFQRCPILVTLPSDATLKVALHRVRDAYLTGWEHSSFPYWQVGAGADTRIGAGFNYYDTQVLTSAWFVELAESPPGTVIWRDPGKRDDEADLRFDVLVGEGRTTVSVLAHQSVLTPHEVETLLTATANLLRDWAAGLLEELDLSALGAKFGVTRAEGSVR